MESDLEIFGKFSVGPKFKHYRVKQKNLAKLSYKFWARADWLCIGSPRLVAGREARNSNVQELFCTTLWLQQCNHVAHTGLG